MCDAPTLVEVSSGASQRLLRYNQLQLYVSTVALLLALWHAIHDAALAVLASVGAKTAAAKSNARSSLLLLRHASSSTTVQLAAWLPGHSRSRSRSRRECSNSSSTTKPTQQASSVGSNRGTIIPGQLQCPPDVAQPHHRSSSHSWEAPGRDGKLVYHQQQYRLPAQLPCHRGLLTVVLDLDETLLCTYRLQAAPGGDSLQLVPSNWATASSNNSSSNKARRLSLTSMISGSSSARTSCSSSTGGYTATFIAPNEEKLGGLGEECGATCWVHYTPNSAPGPPTTLAVFERPGCREFLTQLAGFAEVVLFTAASASYAAPLVDLLDPQRKLFAARLYGEATITAGGRGGVKDLSRLGRPLGRCVLVDNSPYSFMLQPANGLPCLPFHGAPGDRQLLGVILPLLASLAQLGDIRPLLDSKFRVRQWLASKGCDLAEYEDTGGSSVAGAW